MRQTIRNIFVLVFIFTLASCVVGGFDKEESMQSFKENTDWEIGEPYYFFEPENIWCEKYLCIDRGNGYVEYTPKKNKDETCVITWVVDKATKGKYKHPTNGLIFDIAGIKSKWYYVSDPQLCLFRFGSELW